MPKRPSIAKSVLTLPLSPRALRGLVCWVNTDVGLYQDNAFTTPAVSDGDPVGGWLDMSGLGNNFTQATAGNRPLLKLNIQQGNSIVRFNASPATGHVLNTANFSLSAPCTIAWVGKVAGSAANPNWIDSVSAANSKAFRPNAASSQYSFICGVSLSINSTTTNYGFVACAFNRASTLAQVNSFETIGNPGATDTGTGIRIGSTGGGAVVAGVPGDLGELMAYNRILSAQELEFLHRYIRSQWGTP